MPILRIVVSSALNAQLLGADPPVAEQIQKTFDCSVLAPTTDFWHAWSDYGAKEYCLYLDAKKDRTSDEMEEWVREWFGASIMFLRELDALLTALEPPLSQIQT